ncbi:MAG: toxin TcdB middle/N-terminal domain-containing protein [Candidatus Woesearchaeota archaeon]
MKDKKIISSILILTFSLLLVLLVYGAPKETFYRPFALDSVTNDIGNVNTNELGVDLFSGAAVYSYPILVPPGTNGLAPIINLIYNSQSTSERPDMVGTAWAISESFLVRDIEYTRGDQSDDTFNLIINGVKHDLVYVSAEQRFHTEIESYLYIQNVSGGNNSNNNYWIVKTKDGTAYRFGYNFDSEQVSNQESYTTRWYLDLVTDTHDNNIYYSYRENPYSGENGTTYPYKIEYNNDKSREIEFVLESSNRPDIWNVFEQGNNIKQKRRIGEIKVSAQNKLVRKYVLSYQTIDSDSRSFLNEISIYGSDGTSELSSSSFSYNSVHKGWQLNSSWNVPFTLLGLRDSGHRFRDVNRDGYVDVILGNKGSDDEDPENTEVWLNNKTGWKSEPSLDDEIPYGLVRLHYNRDCEDNKWTQKGIDRGFRLIDINLDGFVDQVLFPHFNFIDQNVDRSAYLGDSSSWVLNDTWEPPSLRLVGDDYDDPPCQEQYGNDRGVGFADVNGDGLVDILRRYSSEETWINTRNGWSSSSHWHLDENFALGRFRLDSDCYYQYGIDMGIRLVDINGDGLVDVLTSRYEYDDTTKKEVRLNNGEEFAVDNSWSIPGEYFVRDEEWDPVCDSKFGVEQGIRFADVDGDGLVDILRSDDGSDTVWINDGSSWNQDSSWSIPVDFVDNDGNNLDIRLVDVNGDGLVDIVKGSDTKNVWLNNASKSYLLNEITNDFGGKTEIEYGKSVDYDNTGDDSVSDFGYNIWIVNSIIKSNELSQNSVTSVITYTYDDGLFDYEDKEFRGFNFVEENRSSDIVVRYWFHQDDARKGKEYKTQILDNSNKSYKKTEFDWEFTETNNYFIPYLNSNSNYFFDINGLNPEVTNVTYVYDNYGNINKTSYLGDVSNSGDEYFEYTEFVYNTSSWIVNKPKVKSILDSDDVTKLRETNFYYDNFDYGISPIIGDLTKKEYWYSSGTNPEIIYSYDTFGNLINETNSRGYTTIYVYGVRDDTYTFPDRVINAKGHIKDDYYDLGTGNLLSTTDSNGVVTNYTYDIYGRLTKEIFPYDSLTYPTKEYVYTYDGTPPEKLMIKQREISGQSGAFDSYNFYDGLGKLVQSKSEAENNQQIIVDIFYDEEGNNKKQSNPYFSTSSSSYSTPSQTVNYSLIVYDPLQRPISFVNPDGTKRSIIYNAWNQTGIDENGNEKSVVFDAFQRKKIVYEYVENDKYKTLYSYDMIGNLVNITDNLNNIFRYEFDSLGRKISMNDPDLGAWKYEYDSQGNLLSQNDSNGNMIYMGYDELDRVINKNSSTKILTFINDFLKNGTLYSIQSDSYERIYNYDNRLRIIDENSTINGISFFVFWTYDAMDRIITKTNPDGMQTSYSYNSQGLIDGISSVVSDLNYNPSGLILNRTYNNLLKSEFEYESDSMRLVRIKTGDKQDLNYDYDNTSNIIKISDIIVNKTKNMGYDSLNRLISANRTSSYVINYFFNSIGNILNFTSDSKNITFEYGQTPTHSPQKIVIDIPIKSDGESCTSDLICQSSYCDNDGVGLNDDGWCFTPYNTYFDEQETSYCEFSTDFGTVNCDERQVGDNYTSCTSGGENYFADQCSSTCQGEDRGDNICRSNSFDAGCTADSECNGIEAGTNNCNSNCTYVLPPELNITLIGPSNESTLFSYDSPFIFNFTVDSNNEIRNCSLWANFTGSWGIEQTIGNYKKASIYSAEGTVFSPENASDNDFGDTLTESKLSPNSNFTLNFNTEVLNNVDAFIRINTPGADFYCYNWSSSDFVFISNSGGVLGCGFGEPPGYGDRLLSFYDDCVDDDGDISLEIRIGSDNCNTYLSDVYINYSYIINDNIINFNPLNIESSGDYIWNVECNDIEGDSYWAENNFSLSAVIDSNKFIFQNSSGDNVAWFGDEGNIVLKGTCSQSGSCSAPTDSFIFKDSSSNEVGHVDPSGNLCIESGDCSDQSADCDSPIGDSFIIKDSLDVNKLYVDSTGDLCLVGSLVESGIP